MEKSKIKTREKGFFTNNYENFGKLFKFENVMLNELILEEKEKIKFKDKKRNKIKYVNKQESVKYSEITKRKRKKKTKLLYSDLEEKENKELNKRNEEMDSTNDLYSKNNENDKNESIILIQSDDSK